MSNFLEELFAQAQGVDSTDTGLTDAQVVNRLREVFALGQEIETFTPGQVLLHKWPELSNSKSAQSPVIFLAYIGPFEVADRVALTDPADVFSAATASFVDCKILTVTDGRAVSFLADSREYKTHPNFRD